MKSKDRGEAYELESEKMLAATIEADELRNEPPLSDLGENEIVPATKASAIPL